MSSVFLIFTVFWIAVSKLDSGDQFSGDQLYPWVRMGQSTCPVIIQCQDPCVIEADPDIAGVGVRVATYIQTICNILVLGFASNADRVNSTYGTLVVSSLATAVAMAIFYGTAS